MSKTIKNIIATIFIVGVFLAPMIYDDYTSHYEKYKITIKHGDTLFSLMDKHDVYGDVWDSIHRTRLENNLENDYILQPGDKITLVVRKKN